MSNERHEDHQHLRHAVELAVANVAEGGGPFGAVIVRDGIVIATGVNSVTRRPDPTAHAEVEAIRHAAAQLDTHDLSGCVLYASCDPCPMCSAAIHWARIDRVVYSASSEDAAAAGFDDALLWSAMRGYSPPTVPTDRAEVDTSTRPFEAWDETATRVAY